MTKRNIIFFCFDSCLKHCMFVLRRRGKCHDPFNWQHNLHIFVFKSVKIHAALCLLPFWSYKFHKNIACSCQRPYILLSKRCALIYSTASKFQMHSELFMEFWKTIIEKSNYEGSHFLTNVIFYNWELGSKSIVFLSIFFFLQHNPEGILISTIFLF